MHLDPITGLWKNDSNDYQPEKSDPEEEFEDPEDDYPADPPPLPEKKKIKGTCVLSIRFENAGEYIKWQKYFGKRQWDFLHVYPAIFRTEYEFYDSLGAETLAKKIVQLLEAGFSVYSSEWRLEEQKHE